MDRYVQRVQKAGRSSVLIVCASRGLDGNLTSSPPGVSVCTPSPLGLSLTPALTSLTSHPTSSLSPALISLTYFTCPFSPALISLTCPHLSPHLTCPHLSHLPSFHSPLSPALISLTCRHLSHLSHPPSSLSPALISLTHLTCPHQSLSPA